MSPLLQILLTGAGTLALLASLRKGKYAGWLAILGATIVLPVVVRNVDPVLGIGILAFLGVRLLRVRPRSGPHPAGPPASCPAGTATRSNPAP